MKKSVSDVLSILYVATPNETLVPHPRFIAANV